MPASALSRLFARVAVRPPLGRPARRCQVLPMLDRPRKRSTDRHHRSRPRRTKREQSHRIPQAPCLQENRGSSSTRPGTWDRSWRASATSTNSAGRRRKTAGGGPGVGSSRSTVPTKRSRTPGSTGLRSAKDRVGVYLGITEHGNVEDRERDLRDLEVRLRHQDLVPPPQPADRGQQPGRGSDDQHGDLRPAPDGRRRVPPGTPDSSTACRCCDSAKSTSPLAGGVSRASTLRHLCELRQPGRWRHAEPAEQACRPFDVHRNGIVVCRRGSDLHAGAAAGRDPPRSEDLRRNHRLRR